MTLQENINKVTSEIEAWAIEHDARDQIKDLEFYITSDKFEYVDYKYIDFKAIEVIRTNHGGVFAHSSNGYAPHYSATRLPIKWKKLSTAIKNYHLALKYYPTSKPVINWG